MATLGEAVIKVSADATDFVAALKDDVEGALKGVEDQAKKTSDEIEDEFKKSSKESEKAVKGIGDEFKKLGKLVAGAAIGKAVFGFAKASIDAASDLGESINAVQVTYKELSDTILDFGKVSAKTVGLAASDFNSFAVRFAGFSKQIATGGQSAANVTIELTKRIADFASVMNLDLNDAATVFGSTLAGESEAIRRFGIDMSAASIEAFALSTGLISNKNEMTASIKVQATYAKLMADTNQVMNDFTNTSDSLANRQRILAAEFKDVQAEVGQALIPILNELLGVASSLVTGFGALPDGLQKMFIFAGLAAGAFVSLSSALQGIGIEAKTANVYIGAIIVTLALAGAIYGALKSKGEEARIEQEKLNTALLAAGDPAANLVPQMKALADEYNRLNPAAETVTESLTGLSGAIDFVRASNFDYLPILKKFGSSLSEVTQGLSGGSDAFGELNKDISGLLDSTARANSTTLSLANIKKAIDGVLEVGDPLRDTLIGIAESGELTGAEFVALLESLDTTADAFDDQVEKINGNAEAFIRSEDGARAFAGILTEDVFNALIANAEASAQAAGRTDEYTYLLEKLKVKAAEAGYELDPLTNKLIASADATTDAGDAADATLNQMADYVKALGFVVDESGNVEMSQENLGIAVELSGQRFDDAVQAVEDYESALNDAFDAARSSIDTGFDLVEAQIEATTAVAEYEKAVKRGSLSQAELDSLARETAMTLLAVGDAAVTNAETLAAMNGEQITTAQSQQMMIDSLTVFRDTLDPTSPLAQYLNGFIQTLGGIPTDIPVELTAEVDAAQKEFEAFKVAALEIGKQIAIGILEALSALNPGFKKILDKMRTDASKEIIVNVRVITTTSSGDIIAGRGSLPMNAQGGIFNEPQIGLFAEAGAEAIIPLTRPARALELMKESGLLGLAQQASPSSSQNFDIQVLSSEPMRTAKDVVREFQALEYRMSPI